MKAKLLLFVLACPLGLFAQTLNYNIKGKLIDTVNARYAYLMTLSYRVALTSDKLFQMTPVTDGKFEFKGSFELDGRPYQQASIFFSPRSNITKEEIQSKFRNFIWPSAYDKVLKDIKLENMTLEFPSLSQARYARVTDGGSITALEDAFTLSAREDHVNLLKLIRDNPDSQASFDAIESAANSFSYKDDIKTFWGTPQTLFSLLSERLRNSQAGKMLKSKIDKDSKL
ncbi:MAG: hypothetical protein EOO88_14425 [Pedobacter sp.]|nr:MAG: hypothetical protein EOO88_14425 [Pedobacter sp.]